ncbi:EpsG family protein [Muribaculaceae bacterium Isolate-042 (Harlan)]|nr:EpsG family protein [Muribaculaceae bacterium Isolate-042 (Harlan)]
MIQFLLDITVYASFAFIMSFFARMSCQECGINSRRIDLWLWMYILFFTFISAIRWNVGVDSSSYFVTFLSGDSYVGTKEEEHVWGLWQNFIYNNRISPAIGLGGAAFVQIFFLTDALKRYRRILITLPFILFGSHYFMDYSNAVRQMMAASIFVWGTQFIVNRNLIKYILTILLAASFHHSAVVLCIIYFLPTDIDTSKYRWLWIGILTSCLIIGRTPSFQHIADTMNYLTVLIGYDNYGNRVSDMLSGGYDNEKLAFGPMMLSFYLIGIFTMWYAPKLKETYGKYIPQFDLWYFLSNIYICIYFLVCNISHIFIRPTMYFELFQMIMASLLLLYFISRKYKYTLYASAYYLIIAVCCTWDTWKAQDKPFEASTYKTILTYPYKQEINHFRR